MSTKKFCTSVLRVFALAAVFALGASMMAHAQTPIYWNEDAPPVTDPATPNLYLDQGDNYFTMDPTNIDPSQVTSFSSGDYVVFSSDTVDSEAQTIQLDTEDFMFGLEFNKGAITLTDDGGGTSTIDLGDNTGATTSGITVDSTVNGPTTISPTNINVLASEQWNNNSSQDLIIGGAVTAQNADDLLTFAGTGTGAVRVTGEISGNIVQDSKTSTLYLSYDNNAEITSLTVNGGTVVTSVLNGSVTRNANITVENGGTLTFVDGDDMQTPLTIVNGGTLNFSTTGDTGLLWNNGGLNGDTVTFGTGNLNDAGFYNNGFQEVTQNVQTLNLGDGTDAGRFVLGSSGQGYGFIANTTTINVANNYVFDLGNSGNATIDVPITVASGGGIESRTSGTVTLTNVTLANSGSFVFGADESGSFGNIVVMNNADDLTGTLTIYATKAGYGNENGILTGNFSGTGGLVVTSGSPLNYDYGSSEYIWLKGTNTYSGPTDVEVGLVPYPHNYAGGDQPALVIAGDNSGTGNDYEVQGGWLIVDSAGKMPTTAIVTMSGLGFDPNNGNYVGAQTDFIIGDGNGAATATIGGLSSGGPLNNDSGDFRGAFVGNGFSGGTSTLILDPVAGQVVDFQGQIGDGYADAYGTYEGGGNFAPGQGQYYFNNLKLVKTGAGTQELVDQNNDFNGGVEIDGGVLAVVGGNSFWNTSTNQLGYNTTTVNSTYVLTGSALGTGTVTINNGATLDVLPNTSALANIITLGTAGTVTYDGDSWQAAGTIAGYDPANPTVGTDYSFTGYFIGGGGLVVGPGDLLANTTVAGTPGNIYILGGRLLMQSNGTTFIQNAPSVTVADGGTLDFGAGGDESTPGNQPIYVGANGAINERNTNVTINDLVPIVGTSGNAPSLIIGTDDDAGTTGSITVTNQVNLTSNFTILAEESNSNNYFQYSAVAFTGGFTGTGNLTFGSFYQTGYPQNNFNRGFITVSGPNSYKGDTTVNSGILHLTGDSSAVTSASGGAPNYRISATIPAPGVNLPGVLELAPTAKLAANANIILGGSTAGTFGYFVLGDSTGAANVTVGSITADVGSGDIMNGDTADGNDSILTVDVAANKTDTYTGTIGSDPNNYNFGSQTTGGPVSKNAANISLVKSGAGTLSLDGQNYYSGTTTVNGGKLNINSTLNSGVTVNAGGAIGGSGRINGTISGAGAVTLGDPTILTASSVDASSGMSFNFEFTLAGQPNYASATNSGNDILHLESGSPFITAITSSNVINFYVAANGIFDGGIFVNGDNDILSPYLSNATFDFYILNNIGGTVSYDGNRYSLVSDVGGTATENTFQVTGANFGDGTTDGYEEQITISGAVIPEPSTYALMGVAGLAFLVIRRRIKA